MGGSGVFLCKDFWLKFPSFIAKGGLIVLSQGSEKDEFKETKEPRNKKNGSLLSIESWRFDRDPYVMVYEIIPI